jgi:hypothetical protein
MYNVCTYHVYNGSQLPTEQMMKFSMTKKMVDTMTTMCFQKQSVDYKVAADS